MTKADLPHCPILSLRVVELTAQHEALLQRFFDDNSEYFIAAHGEPARPDEAYREIHDEPPTGWHFTRRWVIGYLNADGSLAAMVNLVSDILAPGVWNITTFIVATARHGSGEAQSLYQSLENWAVSRGARWLRLGVVQGHTRAERFWTSRGYTVVRKREGYPIGRQLNTLRVMYKPLAGGTMDEYLSLVPRDRPENAQAL